MVGTSTLETQAENNSFVGVGPGIWAVGAVVVEAEEIAQRILEEGLESQPAKGFVGLGLTVAVAEAEAYFGSQVGAEGCEWVEDSLRGAMTPVEVVEALCISTWSVMNWCWLVAKCC